MEKNDKTGKARKMVLRLFDADAGRFADREYTINPFPHETVLDALLKIKETKDATLSMRYSCRMGICGSCGMVVNGKPSLACHTPLSSLEGTITVAPMIGHPVLRDLVNDFDDFFNKHKSVEPWIIAKDREKKFRPERPTKQSESNVERLLPFASCIKCGLCLDACPVVNTNPLFTGPQALAQAHKMELDQRDEGKKERSEKVDSWNGIWACEFIGACSVVCPKGVDPALAIQEMKIESMKRAAGFRQKEKG